MKILLFIILVSGFPLICKSQTTAPIGFGNTYTYSEADGIDETNFVVSGITNDGKVFLHANYGALYIKGNNYVHKIVFPFEAQPRHITHVLEITGKKYVIFGDSRDGDLYYYIIDNDSLTHIRKYSETSMNWIWTRIGNEVFAMTEKNFYKLENDSLVFKLSIPLSPNIQFPFFINENRELWMIVNKGNRFEYYLINLSGKAEFQFTLDQPKDPQHIDAFVQGKHVKLIFGRIDDLNTFNSYSVRMDGILNSPILKFKMNFLDLQHTVIRSLLNTNEDTLLHVKYQDKLMNRNLYDPKMNCFYFGSMNKPFRFSPYIKMYPGVFNHISSAAIFTIAQDSSKRIWAASYNGGLSTFDKEMAQEYFGDDLTFLTGSFSTRNHIYLNCERNRYNFGLLQFDMSGHKKDLSGGVLGFYDYLSKDKKSFYYGTYRNHGLWETDLQSLEQGNPKWRKLDSTYGNKLWDIESICEDAKGRIWMGGTDRGFAVYYPKKNKITTWLIANKETNFGFWSSCTDDSGTVWLGTAQRGLLYYNNYESDTIDINKIMKINHPLLQDGVKVMQLKIWGNWLIIGIGKNVLAMDLKKWYRNKRVSIKYINPQEGNFSSPLQENSILIDCRDSTIWFATEDMLYQWDIKKWLSLPVYEVSPNVIWHNSKGSFSLTKEHLFTLRPVDNSADFSIWFQSRDNMPRYLSVSLIKKGDSLKFPPPSLQTNFQYSNLAPGNYDLAIQICQSNGSINIYHYSILVKKFWWQYWWIWIIFFLLLVTPIFLWIASRNKARMVEERAKRREAEQQKALSAMRIVSLGNQFRPHFILNALNTVGAELDNKPQAESVLSRLGESIDLIFSHSQQQKISHPLSDEWRLVTNIIDIHQMMYLKELETDLPEQTVIDRFSNIFVPLGLIQIPVENALLHGLSNKENGPWRFNIDIAETDQSVIINITDNGVGRIRAATLSNYSKHGTGTKNLNSILEIVNRDKTEKILFTYIDGIFFSENDYYGTKVIITIPKNFRYEV